MQASWSRRKFLGVAAGTAGAISLAGTRHGWAAAADAGKFGGYQLGIQSFTLREFLDPDVMLGMVNTLGLTTIELWDKHLPVNSTPEQISAMQQKCAAKGIKILSHGVNNFSKDHEANRKVFEFAKKLGARNITANPSEDSFDSLDKLVEEFDIRVAIHNHGPQDLRYGKIADTLAAIKSHNKKIGACADLGHFIRSGEDPIKAIRLFGDEGRLYGVHLKDFDQQKKDAKGTILGQGVLNVEEVFRALEKAKFPADACLALEYEEKPKDPMDDLKSCVAAASEGARKAKG